VLNTSNVCVQLRTWKHISTAASTAGQDQAETGQSRTGQDQARAGQDKAGQVRTQQGSGKSSKHTSSATQQVELVVQCPAASRNQSAIRLHQRALSHAKLLRT